MPFLQESVLFLQNLFTLYIQGLRALMLALVSANILYRIECLLLEPGSVYEKLFHNIHTRAQSPDIGTCYQTWCPFYKNLVLFLQNLFTLYIQGLRALMLALVSANILYRVECLLLEPGSVYENLFIIYIQGLRALTLAHGACYRT